jgi:hypothetical protein
MYRPRVIPASAPQWKILGAHLKFGEYFVNLPCVFVNLQRNVMTNKLWLLTTFQRKIFKFIDHRGLSFYEYCMFSVVWNNNERILIKLLKG